MLAGCKMIFNTKIIFGVKGKTKKNQQLKGIGLRFHVPMMGQTHDCSWLLGNSLTGVEGENRGHSVSEGEKRREHECSLRN